MRSWTDLTAEERFRIVEMAKENTMPLAQICRMFGVSRTTLTNAIERANEAALEALKPKPRGRKKKEVDPQITTLSKENSLLRQENKTWKSKYQFLEAYNEIMSQDTEEAQEDKIDELIAKQRRKTRNKKKQLRKKRQKRATDTGKVIQLYEEIDGESDWNSDGEFKSMGETPEGEADDDQ